MRDLRSFSLRGFVAESNMIERILFVNAEDIFSHNTLLKAPLLTIDILTAFVEGVTGGRHMLRDTVGMDVRVGKHYPPFGGPNVVRSLERFVNVLPELTPYRAHLAFEKLHPYLDGNGRCGRAIWLYMMGGIDKAPLGFLHHWYYQSLANA